MVVELKEVISKVELLGDEEQKQIAKLLEDEMQWDITLQKTQNQLSNLANEPFMNTMLAIPNKKIGN